MDLSPATLALVVATFFVAGLVKGVTGMGLPTVAMGVLGAVLSPLAAASLLIVPSSVTNLWQLFAGPSVSALSRRLWPMMAAIVLGTLAGSAILAGGDGRATTTALGLALVLYAAVTLLARPWRVPAAWERIASPLVGLATGLVTGATGVFVIPAVPYLQSLGFERDTLVQALGLSFTVSTFALAAGLLWQGAAPGTGWLASALLVLPALVGMGAGQIVRAFISPAVFRRVFLVGLLLLGLEMTARALV
ncbi:membrane protein [Aureimonas endophytica]|uniref:Probable membrane transporter protein n=1 Tax=Aureimonas endophytica TaxID=2027858 RepID=A0A916ZTM6_9HYPH|nr:sulfite exporter TauE/SafE family protein [Aureimonas endophytica]GGE12140.1 membrane protein [Aureimonas endophytica]